MQTSGTHIPEFAAEDAAIRESLSSRSAPADVAAASKVTTIPAVRGLSQEMRRVAAGMRAITAILITLLLLATDAALSQAATIALLLYGVWSALILWSEAAGRPMGRALLHYWIDVAWAGVMLYTLTSHTGLLIFTVIHPVVFASIGYGVHNGVLLALFATVAILVDPGNPVAQQLSPERARMWPALGVLALIVAAAVLARPISVLRQRLALAHEIENTLDPRRGLEKVVTSLVELLRTGMGAQLAAIVLPARADAPAVVGSAADGAFVASQATHRHIETLLADTPNCPLTYASTASRWRPGGGLRIIGEPLPSTKLAASMKELAAVLEVSALTIVPLMRYELRHGHLILGSSEASHRTEDVTALTDAAPDLLRIIETASLVDRLQEESAAHERARIGRDLHDSAIQPYLGLKYAVESLALRVSPADPLLKDFGALTELVNAEIGELREIISGIRAGEPWGDNALVPAVRRQVRRFAQLFGMEVHFESPPSVPTSRVLAGALFHMINEAMNNVRKHTPARNIRIRLEALPQEISLAVRDDGGSIRGTRAPVFMPVSLRERVGALGGSLLVHFPDGLDTEVVLRIPRPAAGHPHVGDR